MKDSKRLTFCLLLVLTPAVAMARPAGGFGVRASGDAPPEVVVLRLRTAAAMAMHTYKSATTGGHVPRSVATGFEELDEIVRLTQAFEQLWAERRPSATKRYLRSLAQLEALLWKIDEGEVGGTVELEWIRVVKEDLTTKVMYEEGTDSESKRLTPIDVRIETKTTSGAAVDGYRVRYISEAEHVMGRGEPENCGFVSSPVECSMSPGNYLMWAERDGQIEELTKINVGKHVRYLSDRREADIPLLVKD